MTAPDPIRAALDAAPEGEALALRVQRLESMRETEKAALLDAFRQIDDLKQRIDFQYMKIHRLEDAATPPTPAAGEGPTRRQLMMLADDMSMASVGDAAEYARAVLARWCRPAPALAEDVAELVEDVRFEGDSLSSEPTTVFHRAADLLEQLAAQAQALQPVAVSERLPGTKDCDAAGRCWWWYPSVPEQTYGYWAHENDAIPERAIDEQPTHWLPARALPIPATTPAGQEGADA